MLTMSLEGSGQYAIHLPDHAPHDAPHHANAWTSACESAYVNAITNERRGTTMKSQKAQEAGERKPRPVVVNQPGTAASSTTPTRHARPSFDDLHAHIATRAYELYVQRGCREGCAVEDWLEAEREIVSREFPA